MAEMLEGDAFAEFAKRPRDLGLFFGRGGYSGMRTAWEKNLRQRISGFAGIANPWREFESRQDPYVSCRIDNHECWLRFVHCPDGVIENDEEVRQVIESSAQWVLKAGLKTILTNGVGPMKRQDPRYGWDGGTERRRLEDARTDFLLRVIAPFEAIGLEFVLISLDATFSRER